MAAFEDYLREVRMSVEEYDRLSSDMKGQISIEWLKLKNSQPAPGNTRLRWPFILHLLLINCTFGLDVMEEFDMMRNQVKGLEEELSDSFAVMDIGSESTKRGAIGFSLSCSRSFH